MGILQSGDPKERMQASHVLVGGRWISKGVWLEPKSLGSGMKANMPERWQDKKNAAGNRFLARTTVSAPYAMLYAGQGSFHAAKVPDATKPGSGPPELQARSRPKRARARAAPSRRPHRAWGCRRAAAARAPKRV